MAKLPDNPNTRLERYLARLAGQDVSIPDTPITRIECYLAYLIENGGGVAAPNAGAHNAIFRGKSLGSTFTEAQADAIDAGTFEDIFIGDYWTIGERVYRVAGLDLFLHYGRTELTRHHAVMVPDTPLANAPMNDSNDTSAGYTGSKMFTTHLATVLETILSDFGSDHVITRSTILCNQAAGGVPSSWTWQDVRVDLMSEGQVYGKVATGNVDGVNYNTGDKYNQFPLFSLSPSFIVDRVGDWLSDIRTASRFAAMGLRGQCSFDDATSSLGVRPYFLIGKAS